jgi:heptosyltransferase-2
MLTHPVAPRPEAVKMHKRSVAEIKQLIAGAALGSNIPQPAIPPGAHQIHEYLHLVAAVGADARPLAPVLAAVPFAETGLAQFFTAGSQRRGCFIGLNPGAEYGPAKRWPAEHFIETALVLGRQISCRWVLFGGLGDREVAEKIARALPSAPGREPLNLAGKTSLRELAAALQVCSLVITNDTGPMHLAAAVGAPVVAIFGSTAPELTGPHLSPRAQVVRQPAPCSPCFLRECPIDLRCLRGLPPQTVVEAALRYWTEKV